LNGAGKKLGAEYVDTARVNTRRESRPIRDEKESQGSDSGPDIEGKLSVAMVRDARKTITTIKKIMGIVDRVITGEGIKAPESTRSARNKASAKVYESR